MAADWVTRGLTQTELVDVVDVGAICVQGRSAEGAPTDPYELARRNGAGTVAAGATTSQPTPSSSGPPWRMR